MICPLCASREFYLLPVGDRCICRVCAPPSGFVPVGIEWVD